MRRRPEGGASKTTMKKLNFCKNQLSSGLLTSAIYGITLISLTLWGLNEFSGIAIFVWSIAQIFLGTGVLCLYRHQRIPRWGAVGAILIFSGIVTLLPSSLFVSHTVQALALTGFSLVLFDLEKINGIPLQLPGGMIFLAVIGSILNTPLMSFAGIVLLTLGSIVALKRI